MNEYETLSLFPEEDGHKNGATPPRWPRAAIAAGLAVLVVTAAVDLADGRNAEPAPEATETSAVPPLAAYPPGGAVHHQHVLRPTWVVNMREIETGVDDRYARQHRDAGCPSATKTAVEPSSAAYLPGGSLDDLQIPHIWSDANRREIGRTIEALNARHRLAARCRTATP